MDATEDDPFVHEVRSTSTLTVFTALSTTVEAKRETATSREHSREPGEATIPMEEKETKRRGRPLK